VPDNSRSPFPWCPDREERDTDRVALLIPGNVYSPERPLLHFARAVFARHGWTTQEVWWDERPPQRDSQDLHPWYARLRSFVNTQVSRVLDDETAPRIALVGKSMGAFAAALAADRNLPGIWLTPVLRDSPLPDDLRRSAAPFLLVGSAADPSWDPEVARSFGQPVYEVPDADHGMEIEEDPVRSAEVLRQVTAAMDAHVRAW
jgi:alpha-beta hydrolase superfamily lysophospholipase